MSNVAQSSRRARGLALRIVIVVVGLVVVAAGAAALLRTEKESIAPAEIYKVSQSSFDIAVTANGELEAKSQVEIRSRLEKPSTIVEIVEEGKRVKAGDVLVRLNSDDIQQQLDEELLRLESAKSDLVAAENAYEIQVNENDSAMRQAKLKHELAEIEYKKWLEGDDLKMRQKNELDIEKAQREKVRLSEKFEKSEQLFAQEFLSKDERDRDEVAAIEAAANLQTALLVKEVYETYERPKQIKKLSSDIEEAAAEIERVERKNASQLAAKEADRTNKRQQLTMRESKVSKLQEQLANCTLNAPQDGLVVYGSTVDRNRWGGFGGDGPLQIGQQVHPNQMLIVLPDTREMVASVRVHEANAGRVKPGQAATLKIDAAQGKVFTGKVDRVSVLAESGGWRDPNLREYTVKIALDPSKDAAALKPSMRCEAEIVLGKVENVLSAPIQAVFNDGPTRFVYTPRSGKFARVPVKIGRRSDTLIELRAGVESGESVLLREPKPGEIIAGDFDAKALAALEQAAPDAAGAGGQGQRRGAAQRPGGGQGAPVASPAPAPSGEAGKDAAPANAQPAASSETKPGQPASQADASDDESTDDDSTED
ncbi:MAG: efflux RND transporter periplasmic adaptor subunit [Phycisphaerales bacterium]